MKTKILFKILLLFLLVSFVVYAGAKFSFKDLDLLTKDELDTEIDAELKDYYEEQFKKPGVIPVIPKREYTPQIVIQDELNFTITQLGNNHFVMIPFSVDLVKTTAPGYKWKFTVTYIDNKSKVISDVLKQDKTSLELDKSIYFTVPYYVQEFNFTIGESSTTVVTSSSASATTATYSKNICIDTRGFLQGIILNGGSDLEFINSTIGDSWRTYKFANGTFNDPGILCDTVNNITYIYYTNSTNIFLINSTNFGNTFGQARNIMDIASMSNPACVFDKSLKLQCVAIESTGLSYYTNSTVWTETAVNDNIADDTDHCTIVAAPNNCIFVACSGTDQDDVDLWSPCLNGWGDTNRVQIQAGSTNPSDPSMIIDYDGRIHLFTD